MQHQDGFPPGFGTKKAVDTPGYKSEGQRKAEKQNQTIQELNQHIPNGAMGQPLEYDSHGVPIIEQPQAYAQPQPQAYAQPQPQPQPQAYEQQRQPALRPQHPVITKLLEKFGLKKEDRHTLELMSQDGTKISYTMSSVSDEIQVWALDEARQRATAAGDVAALTGLFKLLVACASIVAIDKTPTWQVFGSQLTDIEKRDLAKDPLDLSLRIRKTTASALTDIFYKETVPFGDMIFDFYEDKFIKSRKVFSSFDKEYEGANRYVCPLDGCTEYLILRPRLDDNGQELPYFCKMHGVEMSATVDLLEQSDLPLE